MWIIVKQQAASAETLSYRNVGRRQMVHSVKWPDGGQQVVRSSANRCALRQMSYGPTWTSRSISRTVSSDSPIIVRISFCTGVFPQLQFWHRRVSVACLLHQHKNLFESITHLKSAAQQFLALISRWVKTAASVFRNTEWHNSGVIYRKWLMMLLTVTVPIIPPLTSRVTLTLMWLIKQCTHPQHSVRPSVRFYLWSVHTELTSPTPTIRTPKPILSTEMLQKNLLAFRKYAVQTPALHPAALIL